MQKILILVASLRLSSKGHVANWREGRVFPEEESVWEEMYYSKRLTTRKGNMA